MALDAKQKGIARNAGLALLLTLALPVLAVLYAPAPALADDPGTRLSFALRCDLFVLLCLLVSVIAIARARFFSPADIDGSGMSTASEAVRVKVAVLQNTLEQVVLAIGAHVTVAVLAPSEHLSVIPVWVGLFVLGRLSFALGYAKGAPARAFGFGATFYPTLTAYGYAVVLLVL